MAKVTQEIRVKADALLAMGKPAKDVAELLDISYQTVQSWKKRLVTKQEGLSDLETVVEIDLPTLHTVAAAVKENAPDRVSKQIDKLIDGVTGLQQLEPKFHTVVFNLLEAAEEMSLKGDLSVKDWAVLSTGIGALYNSVFNKSGVNVNVMNQTNVSSEKMSMFKSTMRSS